MPNSLKVLMKSSQATITLFGILCFAIPGHPQGTAPSRADQPVPVSGSIVREVESPAQAQIAAAKRQILANPKKLQAFNDLATAYLSRARETANPKYCTDAAEALKQGLSLNPQDFQLQKTQVALLLGLKEYAKAKEQATLLNQRTPDDVMTYGYLAEAEIALGELPAAEKSAQWMLNMRPNNVPGLLLAAKLRALYGDQEGALDLLRLAYTETSPAEVEELAWIANQIASVQIDSGKAAAAMPVLERAEQVFPGYPYTAENLARVHRAQAESKVAVASSAPTQLSALDAATPSLASPLTNSVPTPVKVGLVVSPVSFSPVSQALLTPLSTGTGRMIRNAQASVERSPKDAKSYAVLGAAYLQQARETGDVSDYQLAEKSLNLSLDIVSADFSAEAPLESLAEVCMGEHRFADALTYSQRALSLGSGDASPFAIVGDADMDMGEYDKGAAAYSRLTPPDMTLAPRAAYARDSRISYLRFIAGDTTEAIRLMKVAVAEGIEAQLPKENLAWLYYELGEYFTQAGDALSANASYLVALETHPGDYRALAGLAKLRANNGRYAEAIVLYQKAIAVVPMPIFVGELGDLYTRTGNQAEAKKQYQLVEYIGLLGKINQVLHNRDLALFYADHDTKLPEALTLAHKEFEVRHDIYTWDALAWALYKNGRYADAGEASGKALAHGTRDALLLYHAGMIAAKLGDSVRAKKELTEALAINSHFHLVYASEAQQRLSALNTQLALGAATATSDSHAH